MMAVKRGMAVHATDGEAGRVDDVLSSAESGQPAYLVVDAGGFFSGDVVVPFERVQSADDAGVWLTLTREEVTACPAYDAARYGAGFRSDAAVRFGDDD